jgi:hypothetical protein
MTNAKTRRNRGSSGIEYVIALIFVAMTAIIGYRAFGKQVRCRMGIATTALDLDGKEVNACDDGSLLAQNGPSGNSGANSGGPDAPSINCSACKTKNGCFVAGTPVMTEAGPRPIETITAGTVVLTRDEDGGDQEWRPVLRTVTHRVNALVELTLANAAGATDTLVATPDHPIESLERGWVKAAELVPGRDHLLDADGEPLELVDGESQAVDTLVYNFEVEGTHTYFVGRLEAWVHNSSNDCLGMPTGDHSVPSIGGGGGGGGGEGSSSGANTRSGPDETSGAYWKSQPGVNVAAANKGSYWTQNKPPGGESRSLETVVKSTGKDAAADIAKAGQNDNTQLQIYRTTDNDEAENVKNWSTSPARGDTDTLVQNGGNGLSGPALSQHLNESGGIIPIGAHLGDEDQAGSYVDPKRPGQQKIIKITLKPGANEVLFNPKYTAVAQGKNTAIINQAIVNKYGSGPVKASAAEGTKAGYIGLKSEERGFFSFSLGSNQPSRLLFQQFIDSVEILDPPAPPPAVSSSGKPGGKKPPKKEPPKRGGKPPKGTPGVVVR